MQKNCKTMKTVILITALVLLNSCYKNLIPRKEVSDKENYTLLTEKMVKHKFQYQ